MFLGLFVNPWIEELNWCSGAALRFRLRRSDNSRGVKMTQVFQFIAAGVLVVALNIAWIWGGQALAKKLGITGRWSTYLGQVIIWGVFAIGFWIAYIIITRG